MGNRTTESAKLSKFEVSLFGVLKGTWIPAREERDASWELFIEISTRDIFTNNHENASLREALNSMYSLFQEIRTVLKKYGPTILHPIDDLQLSFGEIAITVLNRILRPFLSKWHQLLLAHENTRPIGSSPIIYETAWDSYRDIKEDLDVVKSQLRAYADLLADACGVRKVHRELSER